MPAVASPRLTRALVAWTAVSVAFVPAPAGASDNAARVDASAAVGAGCRVPLLDRATRGSDVQADSSDDLAAAAAVNDVPVRELAAEVSTDRTLWLDTCGRRFHVEAADRDSTRSSGTADAPMAATTEPGSLAATFTLESNPGAARTIYLDFTGAEVSGTAWNASYSTPSITVAPYSITAPADTAFTSAELNEIQKAWQVVAEDYAPFDVNVTTKPPAAGAIERSGPADTTYGTQVLITGAGPIYDACRCGGVAYVGVFDLSGNHAYYQPAWVFTQGTSTSGRRLGEAAAHEAGHNLGLRHDGASSTYYAGSPPWAPIMGSSYNQPVTQWSAGEYPGATNTEDDVALIAARLGVLPDDHANTPAGATTLAATPLDGVIATRTDTDAFTFIGAGSTALTVTPGPGFPDLDVGLQILDSSGALVASVDPLVVRVGPGAATGMDAVWTTTLPDAAATYTAVVDGVGSGDPTTPGGYSDYASLGHYRVSLVTDVPGGADLRVSSSTPAPATVGVAYTDHPASASGGRAPYAWAATGLPTGLRLDPDTATVAGTPTAHGSVPVTLRVTDAAGTSATTTFVLSVDPSRVPEAPVPTVPVATVPVPETPPVSSVPVSSVPVSSVPVVGPVAVFGFVTRARLPVGHLHRRYRTRITTRGAAGRVTWRTSGTLPGLRLVRRRSGTIIVSGRPTRAGRRVVTVRATDAAGAVTVRRFVLRVRR